MHSGYDTIERGEGGDIEKGKLGGAWISGRMKRRTCVRVQRSMRGGIAIRETGDG